MPIQAHVDPLTYVQNSPRALGTTRSIYWRYQSRRAVRWAHCQMLLKNARTAPVRSVWACETSFSQRAGGSRVAGMHTDRQSKCSAHEVAVRRGSLVAVTLVVEMVHVI